MNNRIAPFDQLALRARRLPVASQDADAVDVRGLLRSIWVRRWLILAVMMLTGALVYVVVSQLTPTYSTHSKVMLDTRKAQIITSGELVADVDPSEQIINSEIAVLRSNLLLEDVVAQMGREMQDRLDPALRPRSMLQRLKAWVEGPAEPLSPEMAEIKRRERLVWALRENVSVYAESKSYVMVIRAEAPDPELAMVMANQIADSYIRMQLESRRNAVDQATGWLEERLDAMRGEVEAAEAAVARFQADSLVEEGGTLDNATQQLADLNSQLIAARAERLEAEARLNQLQSLVAQGGLIAGAPIIDNEAMQALREQEVVLRQRDAVWARSYDETQARRVEIREELEEIRAAMAREVETVLAQRQSAHRIALERETGLRQSIGALERKVQRISENALGLRQLEREATAARMTYESLLSRITEARAQKELQQPDSKLIERAVMPGAPSWPRPKLMAALGAAVAGTALVAWIFFSEVTPVAFRTVREVEAETGLPVLTALPMARWKTARGMLQELRDDPYGRYAERIRQLRTALMLRFGRDRQSVMLLSSAPGEGKTTASLALAEMAVLAGRSVIVVDCDLRRPQVAEALAMNMQADFADFIEGKCHLPDAIYTSVAFGFDVLGARAPRHKAADDLSVSWLKPFLAELTRVYDFVIVDAPALLAVSDAMVMAQLVDTRLYLVAANDTPRAAVTQGLAQLGEIGLTVEGVILNKLDVRRSPETYGKGYEYEA